MLNFSMEKLRRCHYRVYGALDHGQRPVAIYCAMWAALDELSFGNPCGTGPRWKIISSILRGAADFDVRGNMKEEGEHRAPSKSGRRPPLWRSPHTA